MAPLWTSLGNAVPTVVMTLIGDQFRLYGRILPHTTSLSADLGADYDVEVVEILMTMEEAFGIRLTEVDIATIRTIGDVVAAVENAVNASNEHRETADTT